MKQKEDLTLRQVSLMAFFHAPLQLVTLRGADDLSPNQTAHMLVHDTCSMQTPQL